MSLINGRQIHRSNVEATTTKDYYRITYFNEFLSHVIAELKQRFIESPPHGIGLLPSKCRETKDIDVPEVLAQAVPVMFPTEYRIWVRKWKQHDSDNISTKMIDACDCSTFPNIKVLLHLALTIPTTSCESERSFSQLKLVKSSHRSSMSSERLTGLTLMKINRSCCELLQLPSKMSELVEEFQQLHPRRMKLKCVLYE